MGNNSAKEELAIIVNTLKISAVEVDILLHRSDYKYLHTENTSGDKQLEIDVIIDNFLSKKLLEIESIKEIMSEEQEVPLLGNKNGKYKIAFDPLDGSSVVDANFTIGTIFVVYENDYSPKNIILAGYFLYGYSLELVLAEESGINHYKYINSKWALLPSLKLKDKGKLNATGGTQKDWSPKHKLFIDSLFAEGYRLRYSGCMVADLHHILIKKGGLFSYPPTSSTPNGKLRLLFEIFPFAYIFKIAGGFAVNDKGQELLSLEITELHQTSPCFFGSKYEIDKMIEYYK